MNAIAAIERSRLIAIVRMEQPPDWVAEALAAAGVNVLEVSLLTPRAPEIIARWRSRLPELTIGAGTVLRGAECEEAISAGAQFVISPGVAGDVMEAAKKAGVPHMPGALTPTEMHKCMTAGAQLVKLFPASTLGPGYVRQLLGPFPRLRVVPTGGIDESNAGAFLAAGAVAVAVGSSLVRPGLTYDAIRAGGIALTRAIDDTNQGEA